ncbi:hypothetical protein BCU68_05070 [Vibrio sp. 10N.286.49.B3]|uniref:DUF2956 domain-containing protein n=1 Tax=Vibrio sp. 10N.286.49.B3 TaxID=1880855 RepID=UPI000C8184DC|nr:DUF2956 domain-containing protein [Vibrio sp. 10N.286.49.B3]PMH41055.1 hypothetical protein BCU68_05070 [Vibrio sp. 10N.286.49.B3]
MKSAKLVPSIESQQEAMKVAKATQKPGQTKEQTRLIAQGIEKGIALYKKQHKEKQRQADKVRKKNIKQREKEPSIDVDEHNYTASESSPSKAYLPWGLLVASWVGFVAYITLN